MSAQHVAGIQWLRGAAALLVVVDHSLFTLIDKAGADPSLARLARPLGETGVKLFFLISGLVMVMSSTDRFGPAPAGHFVRRRLIRIVPLYWLATTVYLAKLVLSGSAPAAADVLRSYLFIPYLNAGGEMQPIFGLGWTLNYELFFYALFAAGLLFSLYATLFGTAAVLAGAVALGAGLSVDAASSMPAQWLFFWSRPIVLYFATGMFIAWLVKSHSARLAALRLPLGAAIGAAAVCVAATLWLGQRQPLGTALELALLALPVLVLALGSGERSAGWLLAAAVLIGEASYSIYLTHAFIVGPLGRVYAKLGLSAAMLWPFVAVCAGLAALVGLACYRWIERPVLGWLNARLQPVRGPRVPRAVAP